MSKLKTKFGEIILREQVIKHLEEKHGPKANFSDEGLDYYVSGVSFGDLVDNNMEEINEIFLDEQISDGYLMGDVGYEIVGYEDEGALVKVSIGDIGEWLDEELREWFEEE